MNKPKPESGSVLDRRGYIRVQPKPQTHHNLRNFANILITNAINHERSIQSTERLRAAKDKR